MFILLVYVVHDFNRGINIGFTGTKIENYFAKIKMYIVRFLEVNYE